MRFSRNFAFYKKKSNYLKNTINKHPMNAKASKNYDVVVAFVVFLICILYALMANVEHITSAVATVN